MRASRRALLAWQPDGVDDVHDPVGGGEREEGRAQCRPRAAPGCSARPGVVCGTGPCCAEVTWRSGRRSLPPGKYTVGGRVPYSTCAVRRRCYARRHVRTERRSGSIPQGPQAQTAPSPADSSVHRDAAETGGREGVDRRGISQHARRGRSVADRRLVDRVMGPSAVCLGVVALLLAAGPNAPARTKST